MLKRFIILVISLTSTTLYSKNITVMSIDTGVSLSHELIKSHVININEDDYFDKNGHGSHVAGLILKDTCPEVKLVSCKYYYTFWEFPKKNSIDCFERAIKLKPDYINFSSGGFGENAYEKILIETLLRNGTIIVVAAGNDGLERPNYYPAAYELKDLVVVGNLNQDGSRHYMSNYGFPNMVWEIGTNILSTLPNSKFGFMTGSSMSTAIRTNRLLKAKCLKLR